MKYFTMAELCQSAKADELKIDNAPTLQAKHNLNALVNNVLDPIREMWGAGIRVNSGYRNPAVNAAVGGAEKSQHLVGQAVDITTGSKEGNVGLFAQIINSGIPFDQLIDESGYSWIHISYNSAGNRREVKHL